jgi:hypothetical protein
MYLFVQNSYSQNLRFLKKFCDFLNFGLVVDKQPMENSGKIWLES